MTVGDMPTGRILVVDDSRMNRMTLARALERKGHTVVAAEDGIEALEQLRARPFDAVLLDIVMPRKDGFETLTEIKADPHLRDIPVIVISGVEELDSVVRCIEMGALDHLPKPFEPALLDARIRAALEAKRLRDIELDYLEQVGRVTTAAVALEENAFEPGSLRLVAAREDALGQLARTFQRMAAEVRAREEALRAQVAELRIEIDEARQERRVAEITDSDYFRDLRGRAADLRRSVAGPGAVDPPTREDGHGTDR